MLFFSLLFVLAGASLLTAAGIMITYTFITSGEQNLRIFLAPGRWPPPFKKWARFAGMGLASTLLGMILAVAAT